jgi:RNA polymerase sigma factor (sigma-70 family)
MSAGRAVESSATLIQRIQSGDQAALDELCARYLVRLEVWAHGRLPRWARSMVDTQDLVQETLTHVVRQIPKFQPKHEGAFQGYVFRAMINRVLDEIRKAQRRPPADALDSGQPSQQPSPFDEAVGEEVRRRYDEALLRLRDADRTVIVGRLELGLSWEEVTLALDKPSVAATQMALHRALIKLAREMSHAR